MRALLSALLLASASASAPPPDYHNGASLGGWLLTEPSWMYDKFSASAEADLVAQLRVTSDAFAVRTMQNHWRGYLPDAAFDALAAFGATHVRIPIGFWIVEAPAVVVEPSPRGGMYSYGFNHEGFVTGGMNELEAALAKLAARGIKALIDLHAVPGGGSHCASYSGWQVDDAQASFWQGRPPATNETAITSSCGGPYRSSRGNASSWMEVGEGALRALADWVVGLEAGPLAGTVIGLEVVNEPGLQFNGVQPDIERLLVSIVPELQARLAGTAVNVTLNFIGPNDVDAGKWVASQVAAGVFNASRLLIDYHQYYNWDGPLSWAELAAKVCSITAANSPWSQYTAAGLPVVVGEWSDSSNLGARAFTDLSNVTIVGHLRTLYANQMSSYAARGGAAPGAVGQHHWALRMGSGWDPRPTADAPDGAQAPGTAWNTSASGFGEAVWNLGELIRVGVARPLSELKVTGVCACEGCSGGGR